MYDMPAIAVKIKSLAECIGRNEDIGAKRTVEEGQHRVRRTGMKDCAIRDVASRRRFGYRHNAVSIEIRTRDQVTALSKQ